MMYSLRSDIYLGQTTSLPTGAPASCGVRDTSIKPMKLPGLSSTYLSVAEITEKSVRRGRRISRCLRYLLNSYLLMSRPKKVPVIVYKTPHFSPCFGKQNFKA